MYPQKRRLFYTIRPQCGHLELTISNTSLQHVQKGFSMARSRKVMCLATVLPYPSWHQRFFMQNKAIWYNQAVWIVPLASFILFVGRRVPEIPHTHKITSLDLVLWTKQAEIPRKHLSVFWGSRSQKCTGEFSIFFEYRSIMMWTTTPAIFRTQLPKR